MSADAFVKFYEEYLPQHPALKQEIDALPTREGFLGKVMEVGKGAGYDFNESEVKQVMAASVRESMGGNLSEGELDGVVGGAGTLPTSPTPTLKITTIYSTNPTLNPTLSKDPAAYSTVMCQW